MSKAQESDEIPGVWTIPLAVHGDRRGRFMETWRASWLPFSRPMVQANRSESAAGVLRGLHFHHRQADLWYVQQGRVTTVLLDTRIGSPAEGRHIAVQQGGGQEIAVYIPEGVAHGFYAHDEVVMTYLVTNEYDGTDELGVAWDDPALAIAWPQRDPLLSDRDLSNPLLSALAPSQRVTFSMER